MNKKVCLFVVTTAAAAVVYIALFVMDENTHRRLPALPRRDSLLTVKRANTPRDSNNSVGKVALPPFNEKNTNNDSSSRISNSSVSRSISSGSSSSNNSSIKSSSASSSSERKRYLIYVCYRGRVCGGWSDRQGGLVSSYLTALAVGRNFGVIMNNPCNLTQFYVPNQVPWIIPEAELKGRPSGFLSDMGSRGNVQAILTKEAFDKRFPQDVVYMTSNNGHVYWTLAKLKGRVKVPDWARKGNPGVWAKAWRALMKPSLYLQKRLDDFLEGIGYQTRTKPLVCCHVRTGKSATFDDGLVKLNVSKVPVLWNFLDRYVNNGSRLFIATDNLAVRKAAHQRFPQGSVVDSGGSIMHVDKWKKRLKDDEACEGQGYALLDQLILTKCDVLVLSKSGYGSRAALLGGGRQGLFEFAGKSVVPISMH